ncbi:MAG TPA: hypothetical protein VK807_23370 [Gemmatimonadaceae bacterium]|jgi:hypothetical protein|nr:hypothetical protein [Gemmatimonadaceae bacterium]
MKTGKAPGRRPRTRVLAYERACTQLVSRGILGASDEHVRAVLNGEKKGTPQLNEKLALFLGASGAAQLAKVG